MLLTSFDALSAWSNPLSIKTQGQFTFFFFLNRSKFQPPFYFNDHPTLNLQALLRPGRFDRHIMIDLPTLAEREEIFNVYLNKLTLSQPAEVYAKPLSRLTPGMSGKQIFFPFNIDEATKMPTSSSDNANRLLQLVHSM